MLRLETLGLTRLFITLLLGVASAFGTMGCATIGLDPGGQAVWIRSDPPGANVQINDEEVGETPVYAVVPRSIYPKLYLSRDGVRKEVHVETRYRWQASFFSNLVFYVFAPIGWAVDLLDGRAWNPQDPAVVSFRKPGDHKAYPLPYPEAVAIAPPMADSLARSDAALEIMQREAEAMRERRGAHYSILPYESTAPLFLKRGFDFDGQGSYDEHRMLFAALDADAVWNSKLTSKDDGLHLDAILEDKRTREPVDEFHLLVDASEGVAESYEHGRRLFGLPNAVSVALTSQTFNIDHDPLGQVLLRPADDRSWWQQALSYLNAVSITNIPSYRSGRSGRWQLSAYPLLRVSHRDFVARGSQDIDGQDFSRWLVALGYGPELAYQFARSYIYGNIFGNVAWSEISWTARQRKFSETNASLLISTELGYVYSISDVWSVRLFTNAAAENNDGWQKALSQASTSAQIFKIKEDAVPTILTTGISIGYSFEPLLVRGFHVKRPTQTHDDPRNDSGKNLHIEH